MPTNPILGTIFSSFFLTLEGLIIGIFLSDDLFNLYALIEVSTILVSILIMYKKDGRSIYDAMIYLLTNLLSMTFFLLGIGYIYKIFGTLSITSLSESIHLVRDTSTLILPYAFLMSAVGLKIAAMPLFSWLPKAHGAHSAPYIVSALLSGLYIKSSLYLFIRLHDVFGNTLDTHKLFLLIGFITGIVGFYFALRQDDIKLMLAYSTVSQIGLIIFAFSIQTDYSYYGSIYHIISHALFKVTLFLGAGILIDAYGTRRLSEMRGVFKATPFISIIMFMAILGITGAPFFNGSISKYLIKKGTYDSQWLEYLLTFLNIGTILYYVKFLAIFRQVQSDKAMAAVVLDGKIKTPYNQVLAMGILGSLCLITGVFGEYLVHVFFELSLEFTFGDYMDKLIIYCITILIALLVYFLISKTRFLRPRRVSLELNFNELAMSLFFFFTLLLAYLKWA